MKTPSGGMYPSSVPRATGGMTPSPVKKPRPKPYKKTAAMTPSANKTGNGFYHPRGPLFGRGRKSY